MKQHAPENIVMNFDIACSMLFLLTHIEKTGII